MSVGTRLKERRESLGLTQVQLAEMLGVTKGAIGNYETDANSPKASILYKVFEVLKCDANYIFQDEIRDHAEYQATPAEMEHLVKRYRSLDSYGKEAVDNILDTEWRRCDDDTQFLKDIAPEEDPKIIPLYLFPAAAGYASPVFNEDYENYTLKPEDPQGSMFAVRLQGDSMEPDFPDGSIVFCNKDPLVDGDIGIFSVDSGSVCKQYHKEGGVVYLFSLNRARQDADVVLFPSGNRPISCQGRVITRKRYRVPGK